MQRDYGISINWEEVHAITHGLHDNPHHILGPHMEWDGVVVNAYVKDALKVEVIHEDNDWVYEMRQVLLISLPWQQTRRTFFHTV